MQKTHLFQKKSSITSYSWLVWILSALFFFYQNILEFLLAVLTNWIIFKFDITNTSLGFLGSYFFYAHLIFHLPSGILIDRYGPRIMASFGILVTTIGMIIFSYSQTMSIIGLGRLLSGLGTAFAVVNMLKITSNWFPTKQFATLTGLMMTLGLMGPLFITSIFSDMLNHFDPQILCYFLTLFGLIVGVLFFIFVRDSREHLLEKKNIRPSNLRNKIRMIIKNPQNWYLACFNALAFLPITVFAGLWGAPFMESEFNLTHNQSMDSVSFLLLGFAIGAPLFGFLSDKIQRGTVENWHYFKK